MEQAKEISREHKAIEKYQLLIEKTKTFKEEGNKLFASEKYEAASQRYQVVLEGITHELLSDLYFLSDKSYYEALLKMKKECKQNLALMLIKMKEYHEGIRECSDV